MKTRRFIWTLLLIIILLCTTFVAAKWDIVQPKLVALYEEFIAKEQTAEKTEKPVVQQKEKQSDTALKTKKKEVVKQVDEKADENIQRQLVFQITNISYGGGQISGFAPKGWQVQLSTKGQKLKTTLANKKDGRWIVSLDTKDLTEKRITISLSALSPDKKETLLSKQELDIRLAEDEGLTPEVVRREKGKKPFIMQKAEAKKLVSSETEEKAEPKKVEAKKAEAEKQEKASTTKVIIADTGSVSSATTKTSETSKPVENAKKQPDEKTEDKSVSKPIVKEVKKPSDQEDKKVAEVKKKIPETKIASVEKETAPAEKNKQPIQGKIKKPVVTASVKANPAELKKMDQEKSRPEYHLVIFGDSLWKISAKYYGSGKAYWKIYRMNRKVIKKMDLIYPGQKLRLP